MDVKPVPLQDLPMASDGSKSGTERREEVVDTFEANGETVIVKENGMGVEKDHVRVEVSETQVVEVRRRIKNPLTGRRHDLTKLSDDGYLRPFLAVKGRLHSDVVDLSQSPVITLNKDKWELEEKDDHYVAVNQCAEGRFSEFLAETSDQTSTETDQEGGR